MYTNKDWLILMMLQSAALKHQNLIKSTNRSPIYGHLTLRHFRLYKVHSCLLTVLNTGFLQSDQVQRRKPERTIDTGQATGKLYHLRLRVKCALFCNLQSWAQIHAILVIGLYELLISDFTKFTHVCWLF
jgi:hypothetical protein